MQAHVSGDGGDGMGHEGGVFACSSVSDLLSNTVLSALSADDEVVVFQGYAICEIYDGWRVVPTKEIARFTVADLQTRCDEIEELMAA